MQDAHGSRLIVLLDLPGLLDEIGRTSHAEAAAPAAAGSFPSPVSPERHEAQ